MNERVAKPRSGFQLKYEKTATDSFVSQTDAIVFNRLEMNLARDEFLFRESGKKLLLLLLLIVEDHLIYIIENKTEKRELPGCEDIIDGCAIKPKNDKAILERYGALKW